MAYDIEVAMHAFRLMRSGNYTTRKELLEELKRVFPEKTDEQIRMAVATLASKVMEGQDG